jgi:hypothetical protein
VDQSPIPILTNLVALKPGYRIIQNSAVGRLIIALAKVSGFRTINIARVKHLLPELAEWAVTQPTLYVRRRFYRMRRRHQRTKSPEPRGGPRATTGGSRYDQAMSLFFS